MNEQEEFDSMEPSKETRDITVEGGEAVTDKPEVEWEGETLSVYDAILRSDQLRSAGKEQEADELLSRIRASKPDMTRLGDQLPTGEPTPAAEERRPNPRGEPIVHWDPEIAKEQRAERRRRQGKS